MGQVTPVPTRMPVVEPMPPITDHTNGLLPCSSIHGWKWSEIMQSRNPARSASWAKRTSSGPLCSSLERA